MNIQTLEKRIIIKPEDFDKNIETIIKKQIKTFPCSQDYGYIIDIIKIISHESMISRDSAHNIVTVKFEAQTFLPKVGLNVDCVVYAIFPQCIFAEYLDIKIVIPVQGLVNFTYENQMFKKDDIIIKIGDVLKAEILNTRYKQKNYSCIAKLKI